ncbi:hypothetical protein [Streptomyces sp. NPDC056160]|uniref:hypothetical protein n=1 Tax=Streptomyces sp. NPDC056160 TaxID=3345731 RepID=UPI0035E31C7C
MAQAEPVPARPGRTHPDRVVDTLSDLGLATLILRAGYEIGFATRLPGGGGRTERASLPSTEAEAW